MLQAVLQLLDFLLKAGSAYIKTSEGAKEWKDIVDAVEGMHE